MKIYEVVNFALQNQGEYVLGSKELNTHACYLVYGVLRQGEKERLIKPGEGHEEILCLVQGEVVLRDGSSSFNLKQGQALHVKGIETFLMDNAGNADAVYFIAGGHAERHGH